MKDTPRTNFVAHATGDVEWDRSINRFGRMMAHACILERELAAQKEQYRVLEDDLLVLGDERNAAVKDAERYRWLRGEFSRPMLEAFFSAYDARNWQDEFTQLDAEIDAALKEKAK